MRGRAWIAPAVLLLGLFGLWEAICRAFSIPAFVLPPPSQIAAALWRNVGPLSVSAWRTLSMALLALAAAGVFAAVLIVASALSRTLQGAVRPLAVALQVTPVIAIAPLFVIWAGLDHPDRAIVALAAIVAFFPIFSGGMSGLAAADQDLERLFDLYGASPWARLARLRAPSAVPFVLDGVKVAAGLAVIGAVVAEFVAGSGGAQGLAWRILEAGNRLKIADMFAAIFALAVMAAALHFVIAGLERRALRWWRGG